MAGNTGGETGRGSDLSNGPLVQGEHIEALEAVQSIALGHQGMAGGVNELDSEFVHSFNGGDLDEGAAGHGFERGDTANEMEQGGAYVPSTKNPYENPKDRVGSKKLPYWVVPQTALMHLTMGMRDGGYKYGPFNFRETRVVAEIYLDACRRHLTMWEAGEEYADDSAVHHLGHAMACLAILIDTLEHGKLIDNRPKSPETIALLKRLHKQIAEEKRDENGVRVA